MSHRRSNARQLAWPRGRPVVVGALATAVGAFLAATITPLAAAPTRADPLDWALDVAGDGVAGVPALGDGSAIAPELSAIGDFVPPVDSAPDLASIDLTRIFQLIFYDPIYFIGQAYLSSPFADINNPLGVVNQLVNLPSSLLFGRDMIANGFPAAEPGNPGGDAGWLFGDGGAGGAGVYDLNGQYFVGAGGAAGMIGNGGAGGAGIDGQPGGDGGAGGWLLGNGGAGGDGGDAITSGGDGGLGGAGGKATTILLGSGGDGGNGGDGGSAGHGGDGGDGGRGALLTGDGGDGGDGGTGGAGSGTGGVGGASGLIGTHGTPGDTS